MSSPKTGTLKAWNDERGFGFVRPDDDSDDVFLHIKALPPQTPRPQIGQRVRYELVLLGDGKPRAAGARLLDAGAASSARPSPTAARKPSASRSAASATRDTRAASGANGTRNTHGSSASDSARGRDDGLQQGPRHNTKAGLGGANLFWLLGFALLYALCSALWAVPWWVGALYALLSGVSYLTYAFDKHAAQTGAWRVSEKNLLALGLAGGWPGAILAQQHLRHKSSKASFRQAFWLTVVLNVAGFVLLASPLGRGWLPV